MDDRRIYREPYRRIYRVRQKRKYFKTTLFLFRLLQKPARFERLLYYDNIIVVRYLRNIR